MRQLFPYIFTLVLSFFVVELSAQASEKPVPSLPQVTSTEKRIDDLKAIIPYNSLRFGPYGWVYTGRWEVGINLMPWVSSQNNIVSIFTSEAGQSLRAVNGFEGAEDLPQLYVKGYEAVEIPERPGIILLQADVARQFGSGWRTGIGVVMVRSVDPRPTVAADITQLLGADEYAAVSNFSSRELYFTGHLGYTFRRNKRFRPAIGLVGITPGKYYSSNDYTVYSGEDGQVVYETFNRESTGRGQFAFYLMGRVGIQYQVLRHFSVGLDAAVPISIGSNRGIPLIGIGGRYSFARSR